MNELPEKLEVSRNTLYDDLDYFDNNNNIPIKKKYPDIDNGETQLWVFVEKNKNRDDKLGPKDDIGKYLQIHHADCPINFITEEEVEPEPSTVTQYVKSAVESSNIFVEDNFPMLSNLTASIIEFDRNMSQRGIAGTGIVESTVQLSGVFVYSFIILLMRTLQWEMPYSQFEEVAAALGVMSFVVLCSSSYYLHIKSK
jgi:hypothetical protein